MKKVFIFLPDGVGLKNFAHSRFYSIGKELGANIIYWNNTSFPLKEDFGYNEIQVPVKIIHPLTDFYKRAKINIELELNYQKTKKQSYRDYIFKPSTKGIKNKLKNLFVNYLIKTNSSDKGLQRILTKIYRFERKSDLYKASKEQLIKEQPDFILSTSQRSSVAIAPMLAAKDLNIPTACFIFSWDNLPKATLLVKTDYYFVWSVFMKKELLHYAPQIKEHQVIVTGTPQFEPHSYTETYQSKEAFYKEHNLEITKEYVCFSGDDETTSPNDEYYFEDLVESVQELNEQGYNLGVIFRKCPVDFSNRYNFVIKKYPNIVKVINPKWSKKGEQWNAIMPLKQDLALLTNTCKHSFLIANIGSSMVFDAVNHKVPCAYFNYNTIKKNVSQDKWYIEKIYKFIHFESMPDKKSVLWINSKEEIKQTVLQALHKEYAINHAQDWYDTINNNPQNEASKNIWQIINAIVK